MAADPIVRLQQVEHQYGERDAFRLRVSRMEIAPGEVVACIGPSGCGKTTLLQIVAGIVRPLRGRVGLFGEDLAGLSDRERRRLRLDRIGVVFQELELLPYLTAAENIGLGRRLGAAGQDRIAGRASALAGAAGIDGLLGRKPARLSQGERQRVAVCRALASGPELVLCDEPTGNLDPATTGAIVDLLLGDARSRGAGLLMVTHNHSLLDRFDRVVRIERGPDAYALATERAA